MNGLSQNEFIELFPALRHAPEGQIRDMLSKATLTSFPAEMLVYSEGDVCSAIAFLISGEIRVYKVAEGGREITLYEIGRGETCILNASCILANTPYPANAFSLKEGSMLLIPGDAFHRLMATSEEMRHFVFEIVNRRLTTVMALVEEVAFGRMDLRLKEYLSLKAEHGVLRTTHQNIAYDMGTSREVVSRLLKDLERKGNVALSRNEITLLKS
jgi:CRP/FNR family transcriptional regulator